MNRTGVVVVTYNSGDVIERCLDSCAHLRTVVIDNASRDNTRELVRRRPAVELVANPNNRGFAGAVNQGVALLDTEMILLLNPDVELNTSVDPLEDACSRDAVGLATGQLVDLQGRVQTGFTLRRFPTPLALAFEVMGINRVFPGNPVNRRYRCLDLDLSKPSEAEQPPGAFLMFRREVWQRLGGFDTQFHPLWFRHDRHLQ
jgi:N-acetylglucosaminyl-diphospho-decaprenol L-rhamnosyltransferase